MSATNIDNILSQMKKGILEYCILSIIQRGEAYPSDIATELNDKGMPVLEGTLYPLLTRLKNSAYLDYRWVESSSGPPRKYFKMTEKGQTFYASLRETWNNIQQAVQKITLT